MILMLLASCKTQQLVESNEFTTSVVLPPLFSIALDGALSIEDPDSSLYLIQNIADQLILSGYPGEAELLLDDALLYSAQVLPEASRLNYTIGFSRLFLEAGIVSRTLSLLEEALSTTDTMDDIRAKSQAVLDIIIICFDIGPDATSLLRQAIQRIYIIEDYSLRSSLLLETARRYQEQGEGTRSNVILQQAITSVVQMEPSMAQAQAFSLLGRRFLDEDNIKLSEVYSQKSLHLLSELTATDSTGTIENSGNGALADTLINLSRSGYAGDALSYLGYISSTRLSLSALLEMARAFYLDGNTLQSDLAFERIFSSLERSDDTELIVSMLLNISDIWQNLGDPFSSLIYLDATDNYLPQINDTFQRNSLAVEIITHYANKGYFNSAESMLADIDDEYFLNQGRLAIAEGYLANPGGTNIQSAVDILSSVVSTESSTEEPDEGTLGNAALLLAQSGNFDDAVDTLALVSDLYTRLLRFIETLGYAGTSADPSEDYWNDIRRKILSDG